MAPVHGMDNFPEKSVILVEEDTGLAKSVYAQYIAAEAACRREGCELYHNPGAGRCPE